MKYVWAFFCWAGGCPPRDFVGSWGCEIRALDFFPIALRLDRHRGSSSAELPIRFRGDTINIHAWSRGSRDPRDLTVGFLAALLTGALNNLLECIAYNIYRERNNLNDPCHYFVIGPSSSFCMDVCDHVINVFPVHLLNKRFLINWLTYERPHVDVCDMSICTFIHKTANVFSALSHAQVHELLNAVMEA